MTRKIDLEGQRFGRLLVGKESHRSKHNQVMWHCTCDCGTLCVVKAAQMRSGKTQSCGCLGLERRRAARIRHGKSGSYEYKRYMGMKNRCYNERDINFENYGGKGITVDSRWLGENGFVQFMEDMGPMPEKSRKWTIERINCKLGYGPDNCIWLHESMQAMNKNKICTNTSGFTGVSVEVTPQGGKRYRATWCDLEGKLHTKSFAGNKYGDEEALKLAVEYRAKMIEDLNKLGASYSEGHGK